MFMCCAFSHVAAFATPVAGNRFNEGRIAITMWQLGRPQQLPGAEIVEHSRIGSATTSHIKRSPKHDSGDPSFKRAFCAELILMRQSQREAVLNSFTCRFDAARHGRRNATEMDVAVAIDAFDLGNTVAIVRHHAHLDVRRQ